MTEPEGVADDLGREAIPGVGDGFWRHPASLAEPGRSDQRRPSWQCPTEGFYAYEAPGETHTLVVDPYVEEMITLFQVNGATIYVDPDGVNVCHDDVFTRIDKCRAHYARNGLGEGYVDQFIR